MEALVRFSEEDDDIKEAVAIVEKNLLAQLIEKVLFRHYIEYSSDKQATDNELNIIAMRIMYEQNEILKYITFPDY